ncbi:MAG: hypothetical protein ACREFX_11480 [Opitutaceae bacterium]
MPLDDAAVWLCRSLAGESGTVVAGPAGEQATLALDKWRQIEIAREARFAVPTSRLIVGRSNLFHEPITYPVVLKPVRAVAARQGRLTRSRAWFCSTEADLRAAALDWDGVEPMLLQAYVSGVGEGIFGLAGRRGVLAWSAHRRIRMMNPQGSGSSACQSRQIEEPLMDIGNRFVARAGWQGLFMIELLRDQFGTPWFMEMNGRTWGSMALARRLGFEYPAWAIRLALDPDAEIRSPGDRPSITCRHLGRELVHLAFAFRGPKSKVAEGWPSRWHAFKQIARLRRHDRWYNWRRDDCAVFFKDTIWTIGAQLAKLGRGR